MAEAPQGKGHRIVLSAPQAKIWSDPKRFKIACCGRRFGKSFLALAWITNKAQTVVGKHWYVGPSFQQTKDICWRPLKNLLRDHISVKNEAELTIELKNGSIIQLKSADNPDSLHGSSLSSVVMDECRFFKPDAWAEGISPATSDKLADVLFITTPPEENNWFTELIEAVQTDPDYERDWSFHQYTTLEGGNVPEEEVQRARAQLDMKTFRRMYEASIETMGNRVYREFDRKIHVRDDIEVNTSEIWVGMDFNVTPMTAVIGMKLGKEGMYIFDEVWIEDSEVYEVAEEILRRYPNASVQCRPDPAARWRNAATKGGKTSYSILEQYGFHLYAPQKHDGVIDRVNTVNAALRAANGGTKLYFHPRCKRIIDSLQKLPFKEGSSVPNDRTEWIHITDALGYLVSSEYPIVMKLPNINIKFG